MENGGRGATGGRQLPRPEHVPGKTVPISPASGCCMHGPAALHCCETPGMRKKLMPPIPAPSPSGASPSNPLPGAKWPPPRHRPCSCPSATGESMPQPCWQKSILLMLRKVQQILAVGTLRGFYFPQKTLQRSIPNGIEGTVALAEAWHVGSLHYGWGGHPMLRSPGGLRGIWDSLRDVPGFRESGTKHRRCCQHQAACSDAETPPGRCWGGWGPCAMGWDGLGTHFASLA